MSRDVILNMYLIIIQWDIDDKLAPKCKRFCRTKHKIKVVGWLNSLISLTGFPQTTRLFDESKRASIPQKFMSMSVSMSVIDVPHVRMKCIFSRVHATLYVTMSVRRSVITSSFCPFYWFLSCLDHFLNLYVFFF